MAKPIKGDASAKVSSGPEPEWLAGWVIALNGSLSPHPNPLSRGARERIGATESSAVGLSLNQFPLPYEERARVRG